jgi:hypothetical protein
VVAWSGFEPPDSGLTERARSRIRNGALYGPAGQTLEASAVEPPTPGEKIGPAFGGPGRKKVEQLAGDGAKAEARADRRRDLGQPLARVDLEPVRLLEAQQKPELVQREERQVGAGHEHGRAHDPVLPGEPRDELLGDRAA